MTNRTLSRPAVAGAACCPPRGPAGERRPFIADDARLLKALADETRLGIVLQLREQGEVCQCDFAAGCTVQQPTVSHHLKVLRRAGIVAAEKRGVWTDYRLNPASLEGCAATWRSAFFQSRQKPHHRAGIRT